MPDIIRFSDMKNDHPLQLNGANDLLAIAVVSGGTETGYNSMTTTPNQLGQHTVIDQEFANLTTTAKTIQGAINELKESGGGSAYTKTLLYDTETPFAIGSTITFPNNWSDFDELRIYCYWKETVQTPNYYAHRAMMTITNETLTWSLNEFGQTGQYRGLCDLLGSYEQNGIYSSWGIKATTVDSITCVAKYVGRWSADACVIKEIYGIKY